MKFAAASLPGHLETRFDLGFVAEMALREKQVQQRYRPVIAVHKWFARRPGSLFRALLLSEFSDQPLAESYFRAHDFPGRTVADPFMGGGTPLLEANRVGCEVVGRDLNPMAAWIVREEMESLDLEEYERTAAELIAALREDLGDLYRTDCPRSGREGLPVKYFLRVKVLPCEGCGVEMDLFPGYLLADDRRHTAFVIVCSRCGALNERRDPQRGGRCDECPEELTIRGLARRGRRECRRCGRSNRYPRPGAAPLRHRLFAIEYHDPHRAGARRGRLFKKPDERDLARCREAERRWSATASRYVPEQEIPVGDETNRLHRWGYRRYRDLFHERQLLGLESSARRIAAVGDDRIRRALATNFSDLLRYQNLLCRYDASALKSLDIFSVHGFPVGLVPCESNLLGVVNGKGKCVGSGGWSNIVAKYRSAKEYCEAPYEVAPRERRRSVVPVRGEWIGERRAGARSRRVEIRCGNGADLTLPPGSLDAVFTDPPYFGNVQYGELMDFCYVWLRLLAGPGTPGFEALHGLSKEELTGNRTSARSLDTYAAGLSRIFRRLAAALKPGAPFAFTFHHNRLEVYGAVGAAILDAGLTCTASIPCPAEMGSSIHIRGTGSSILDTVFVCRAPEATPAEEPDPGAAIAALERQVLSELEELTAAGMTVSAGDLRCLLFGHATRLAVRRLRSAWRPEAKCGRKQESVLAAMSAADPEALAKELGARFHDRPVPAGNPSLFDCETAEVAAA